MTKLGYQDWSIHRQNAQLLNLTKDGEMDCAWTYSTTVGFCWEGIAENSSFTIASIMVRILWRAGIIVGNHTRRLGHIGKSLHGTTND